MFSKTVVVRDSLMNSNPHNPSCINEKYRIIANIKATKQQLSSHPVCTVLTSKSKIKAFILYHIFDVWDTNKLVQPLQNEISSASL